MGKELVITTDNAQEVFTEINARLWDIPFDNSEFQTKHFVIDAYLTPERKYRAAALRLQSRLNALREASFTKRKNDVKIRQLQSKIEVEPCMFTKELMEIEVEEIDSNSDYFNKLINDAIVECNFLYDYISSCPKYTREDFELAEKAHFEQRLLLEANGVTGALKSLSDMGVDLKASEGKPQLIYKGENNVI